MFGHDSGMRMFSQFIIIILSWIPVAVLIFSILVRKNTVFEYRSYSTRFVPAIQDCLKMKGTYNIGMKGYFANLVLEQCGEPSEMLHHPIEIVTNLVLMKKSWYMCVYMYML
jgi:hypothetical protein